MKLAKIGNLCIGNNIRMTFIAGPCAMESEDHAVSSAYYLKEIAKRNNVNLIFKSSFDKANRTSIYSDRGVGIELGREILHRIKTEVGLPTLTDIHEVWQVNELIDAVDVYQIPALLSRQTDLIDAAGRTGKLVNIKKGQFMNPKNIHHAVIKADYSIRAITNKETKVLLTERGTTFGYDNLVVDMRSLQIMKQTGCPVIFDATHSVQLPGGKGKTSGGEREFVIPLAKAATAMGIAGVFAEVHENPTKAISDGPNMLTFKAFELMVEQLLEIDDIVKNQKSAEFYVTGY